MNADLRSICVRLRHLRPSAVTPPARPAACTTTPSARLNPSGPSTLSNHSLGRVRVATPAPGADRHGRDAEADRDVRVGRGNRELGLAADEARGFHRGHDQRVIDRRLAARSLPDDVHRERQRRRSDGAAPVLLARSRGGRVAYVAIEPGEHPRRRRAHVHLEPRLVRDGVHRDAAADPSHRDRACAACDGSVSRARRAVATAAA